MTHKFGDAAIYVKDGKPLNALVVKSNAGAVETLNLLYLDPSSESFVGQGNASRLVSSAVDVKPLAEGAKFGWTPLSAPEQLDEAQGPVTLGAPESPHALTTASVEDQKATVLAAQINTNLGK